MTYNVFSGTLNLTQSIIHAEFPQLYAGFGNTWIVQNIELWLPVKQ